MLKKTQINFLTKAYKKSFKNLNKLIFKDKNTGLLLFAEYLRFIRDSMIIEHLNDTSNQTGLATIITAVAEFDAYNCSDNAADRSFHWHNFCELVKQNMEDWLRTDDSI